MKLKKDPGWKLVTAGAQVELIQHNKEHKIIGDSRNTQEATGTKDLVFWTQASPPKKPCRQSHEQQHRPINRQQTQTTQAQHNGPTEG